MSGTERYLNEITATIKEEVLGQRIIELRHQTAEEAAEMGWEDQPGIIIRLENGHQLIVSRDEEGNGPGALLTTLEGAAEVLTPEI